MQSWYWFPCNITCLSTGIITITWASSGICQLSWSGNHSRLMCGNHGKSLCSITDDSAAVSIKTIRQLYLATAQVIEGKQATTCSIMSPPPPPNHSRVYWGEGISHIRYLGFISLNHLSLCWQIPGTVNTEKTFMAKKLLKCHIKFTMRSFIYF